MKYSIRIEGGFTGIPKEYHGDIELDTIFKQNLLKALTKDQEENSMLRDGLKYQVAFSDKEQDFQQNFDETNVPTEVREFIAKISKRTT
jgi:hypothetical protein